MAETHAPAPRSVSIHVYPVGGKNRAFVLPPYFHVGKGDTKVPSVQWENQTTKEVKLWFPNGWKLFDGDKSYFANPFTIGPDQKSITCIATRPRILPRAIPSRGEAVLSAAGTRRSEVLGSRPIECGQRRVYRSPAVDFCAPRSSGCADQRLIGFMTALPKILHRGSPTRDSQSGTRTILPLRELYKLNR